jgi:hypothetical protein
MQLNTLPQKSTIPVDIAFHDYVTSTSPKDICKDIVFGNHYYVAGDNTMNVSPAIIIRGDFSIFLTFVEDMDKSVTVVVNPSDCDDGKMTFMSLDDNLKADLNLLFSLVENFMNHPITYITNNLFDYYV